MNELISRADLARFIGIHKRTLMRHEAAWSLRRYEVRLSKRYIRYHRPSVIAHLRNIGVIYTSR